MNSLRKISITLKAQFSDFVRQIENHEAIAEAVLKDFRANIHNAKFRLRMLERSIDNAATRALNLEKDIDLWRNRALQLDGKEEGRALECVRRMKSAETEKANLEAQIKEMRATRDQVTRDITHIEGQYQSLKLKHQTLMSRQTSAEAIRGLKESATSMEMGNPVVFEDWEASIVRKEVESELVGGGGVDSLESELRKEEETEELKAILADLKTKNQ